MPWSDDTLEYTDIVIKTLRSYFNWLKINANRLLPFREYWQTWQRSRLSTVSALIFFNNLCLCHHSIKSEPLWVAMGGEGGGGESAVLLSHSSENIRQLCSLLPFALWWRLAFSAWLAMWSSYKSRRGRGRLGARICMSVRACVRAAVRVCLCVGGVGWKITQHTGKRGSYVAATGEKSCTWKYKKIGHIYISKLPMQILNIFPLLYKYCSVNNCLLIAIICPR